MVFWHQSGTNRHFDLAPLNRSRPSSKSVNEGSAGYGRSLVRLWRRWNDSLFHRSDKVDDDVALVLDEPILLMDKNNELFAGARKLQDFLSHEPILSPRGTDETPS
ncbi:hypothetical protein AYO43_03525 [Nitrospira sp. SCGC AG-212-E16]|nr:hypothetical protein AYO43_03525 [Nitrospira sp. SCGC AG-212-E16]